MRKIMVLAAMLAMMMVASSPAMADEIDIDSDDGVVFTSEFTGDSDDVEDFFDEIEDEELLFFSDFYDFDEDDDESFVIFDSEDSDFDEFEFEDNDFGDDD
jgi:hypothetical protein